MHWSIFAGAMHTPRTVAGYCGLSHAPLVSKDRLCRLHRLLHTGRMDHRLITTPSIPMSFRHATRSQAFASLLVICDLFLSAREVRGTLTQAGEEALQQLPRTKVRGLAINVFRLRAMRMRSPHRLGSWAPPLGPLAVADYH